MALDMRDVETKVGLAQALYRQDKLNEVFLGGLSVDGVDEQRRFFGLDRVIGEPNAIIERAAEILVERSAVLPEAHRRTMEVINPPNAEPVLTLQGRFQMSRDWSDGPPTDLETDFQARLYYHFEQTDLVFDIRPDGTVVPNFEDKTLEEVRFTARLNMIWDSLPEVVHAVFGRFKPDRLITVAPQKLDWFGRKIQVDLWIPERQIEGFNPAVLDPFVPLVTGLKKAMPKVAAALTPLRLDWATDWLDPSNAPMAGAFRAAFPGLSAASDLSEADFVKALWLKRILVALFEEAGPQVTWDFYALPEGEDSEIFVARTDPAGRVIEVTTES